MSQRENALDRNRGQGGFTLVEMLAALAIASVIIFATAALLHNVALTFDRGTSRVAGGERLALAAERLATDIASANDILLKTPAGIVATFAGAPSRVLLVSSPSNALRQHRNEPQFTGQEVVSLTVEAVGETAQIVRRRGAWPGPRTPFDTVRLKDEVVLLAGVFDASFTFARLAQDGTLSWVDNWSGERTLPRLVKLTVRDRATGGDLLGGTAFAIRTDAPAACAVSDAGLECLTGADTKRLQTPQTASTQSPKGTP